MAALAVACTAAPTVERAGAPTSGVDTTAPRATAAPSAAGTATSTGSPAAAGEQPLALDTTHCPPDDSGPGDDGPVRIGVNGGGFNGSRHIEGLQQAVDEANGEGGIGGRPIELVTAIELQSDFPLFDVHIRALVDRGDLHAVVPWGGAGVVDEIADMLAGACLPGLFWLAAEAPDVGWVTPGLADRRAEMAVAAEWLSTEGAREVVVIPTDWPSDLSLADSLVASLERRGVEQVALAPIPVNPPGPIDLGSTSFDAAVIITSGSTCEQAIERVRTHQPDAAIVVARHCRPWGEQVSDTYQLVHRVAWLEHGGQDRFDPSEEGRQEALATGRAVVEVLRAAAEGDDGLTPVGILRSANDLSVVLDDTLAGVNLRTRLDGDRFARERGVIEVWDVDPVPFDYIGWHPVGPAVKADGTTPYSPIDRTVPTIEPETPCAAPDSERSINTAHWFGENGVLDPQADIVLGVYNAGLDAGADATLVATGADGTTRRLAMTRGRGGTDCAGERFFDLPLGQAGEIASLDHPVSILFELSGPAGFQTVPVTWPDDFPLAPPFGNVRLEPDD